MKPKRSILLSAILVCCVCFSFGQWTTTNLSMGTVRMGSAVLGNKIYFAGGIVWQGSNSYATNKVEIYNMETGEWQLTNLSIARQWPTAIACGDSIFIAGGMSDNALPYSRVDIIYNDILWNIHELSVPRFALSAVNHENLFFFAGGLDLIQNLAFDVIDIYNRSTGEWSVDHLSIPRGGMGCAVLGDRAFFAGGCGDGNVSIFYDRVDIYNFTTGTWDIAALSQARSFIAATVAGNKVIFAGGSLGMGIPSNVVDIYDAETDTWSTAEISIPRGFWSNQAATINDKAYFVGNGVFNFGWDTDTIDIYDPVADEWSIMTMPYRLNDHAVVETDTSMLIAGGWTYSSYPNGDPRSEVEIWVDPATGIHEVGGCQSSVTFYPNPTHGIVDFRWSIFDGRWKMDNAQWTILKVYNAQGQEVATLLDGMCYGDQVIRWDMSRLPAGIYYYQFRAKGIGQVGAGKVVKY
jgi:hypothetical protein